MVAGTRLRINAHLRTWWLYDLLTIIIVQLNWGVFLGTFDIM